MMTTLAPNSLTPLYLSPPGIDDPSRYRRRYFAAALPAILRRHQLRREVCGNVYAATFRLSYAQKQAWLDAFDAPGIGHDTPFTYYTTVGTLVLMRILADIGINFRHLLHGHSEMHFEKPAALGQTGVDFDLTVSADELLRLRRDRVVLTTTLILSSPKGVLATITDHWVILNLSPAQTARLKEAPSQPARFTKPDSSIEGSRTAVIDIPADAGRTYGRLSGDLNPFHTTPLAARLLGYRRPFVQGLFVANHVLKEITAANGRAPRTFTTHFKRPVFCGQATQLQYDDDQFSLFDGEGRLLVYGRYQA